MGQNHVTTLERARQNFTRKRREMAEQMIPAGAASAHFAPAFADLQAAIDAIDRAIEDERRLPLGYADQEPEPDGAVVVELPISDHDPA